MKTRPAVEVSSAGQLRSSACVEVENSSEKLSSVEIGEIQTQRYKVKRDHFQTRLEALGEDAIGLGGSDMDRLEEYFIGLENAYVKEEMEWYLSQHYYPQVQMIGKLVERALELFHHREAEDMETEEERKAKMLEMAMGELSLDGEKVEQEKAEKKVEADIPSGTLSFKTRRNDLILQGFIRIAGYYIVKGEFMVAPVLPNKQQGPSLRTCVYGDDPIVLKPLKNAYRHLDMVHHTLASHMAIGVGGEAPQHDLEDILHLLASVLTGLEGCVREMVYPDQGGYPDGSSHSSFKPPVSKHFAPRFNLSEGTVVVEWYYLRPSPLSRRQRQGGDWNAATSTRKRALTTQNGITFEYRGRPVEVVSHAKVDCPIPRLREICQVVGKAHVLCKELKSTLNQLRGSP